MRKSKEQRRTWLECQASNRPEIIEKKLQEKTQENPYFTLNYQENSGFPGFFPGVFF